MKIYENFPKSYNLWRNALSPGSIEKEINFLLEIIKESKEPIKSIIDLGGGIGLHSDVLQKRGYEVTIYDISKKSLGLAQKNNPHLKIIRGSFEEINVSKKYDAAISMWTTFTYVLDKDKIKHFFKWISNNIKYLIILDQGNFYLYPKKFHKIYNSKIDNKKIKIIRDWTIDNNYLRTTKFQNYVTESNGKTKVIVDIEHMQFLEAKHIQKLLGDSWKLSKTYGSYNKKETFNKNNSSRMILKFIKKNSFNPVL